MRPARLGAIAVLAALLTGCSEPAPVRTVIVEGTFRLPPGTTPPGKLYVSLYHAWSLQGELRHPLQLIEQFEATAEGFSHRFDYPERDGEGLVVYAWADLDGDGVLCTPAERRDPAGLTEVPEFPADRVSVVIDLAEPCRGPDWFYPRAPANPGTQERSST